jgi:hypothetical protein
MNGIHVRGRWGTGLPRHDRAIPLKAPLLAAGIFYFENMSEFICHITLIAQKNTLRTLSDFMMLTLFVYSLK